MARSFARASAQYLKHDAAPLTTWPLTFAAWCRTTLTPGATQYIMAIGDNDAANGFELRLSSAYAVEVVSVQNGISRSGATSTTTSVNTWIHAAGTVSGSSSRTPYLNGVAGPENTLGATPGGLDTVAIGAAWRTGATGISLLDGQIAHAAIWSDVLTPAEISALYNNGIGVDPRSVRPDALVAYWPLLDNDGDRDWWGGYHMTPTNSPTYAQHPPVLMKSKPAYVILNAAAAAPTISSVTLSGTRQIGNTLTATAATTPASVDSTAYRWQQASDGSGTGAADISGETAQTLALTYTDFATLLDAGDAYVRCGAIATVGAQSSDEVFSDWQQVNVPAGAGFAGSPLKSPFLIV